MNRSVVREALKRLEVHRLVRPIKRRGTIVLDPSTSLSAEVIRVLLVPEAGRVDIDVLKDLLELRTRLDAWMAGLAAARRAEADLAAMDAALAELEAALGDHVAYGAAQDRLALALAQATRNRLFPMLVHWHARIIRDVGGVISPFRLPVPEHLQGLRLLVELVRERRAEEAEALVLTWHAWATPTLLAALGETESES